VLALLGGVPLAACTGDFSLRYRLTTTVTLGDRRIVGSSVREMRWHERWEGLGSLDTSGFKGVRGEAAIVDLGQRGLLVATLAAKSFSSELNRWVVESGTWSPVRAFDRAMDGGLDFWRRRSGVVVALRPEEMPVLVTFGDPRAQRTAREVDPANLAADFGSGARLESITVEISHDPITRGRVQRALPWLSDMRPGSLRGEYHHPGARTLIDDLSRNDFTEQGPGAEVR
jgi:hypothetical protein